MMDYGLTLKANPYHDTKGRFSSGPGGPTSAHAKLLTAIGLPAVQATSVATRHLTPPSPRGQLPRDTPKEKQVEMMKYMTGYSANLRNQGEREYVQSRIRQMIKGEPRPKGASKPWGLTKDRVIALESVTYKVFQAGRAKLGV